MIQAPSLDETLRYGRRLPRKDRRQFAPPPPPAGLATAFTSPDGVFVAPPPTTNMTLWLNGRTGITSSGGVVSAWADQSGNGNNFTQGTVGNRPTTGTLNGLTAVSFAAASSQYLSQSTTSNLLSASAFTIFAVWQYTGTITWTPPTNGNVNIPSPFYVGASDTFGNCIAAAKFTTTPTDVALGTCVSLAAFSVTVADVTTGKVANPHQSYHAFNGSDVYVSIDTNAITSTAAAGTLTDIGGNTDQVGRGPTSTNQYWQGTIGEIIVYNAYLGASEISQIQSYLTNKWGTLGP